MDEEILLIGKAAARAGVNIQTLRYYERRGLLAEPERSPAGQRWYKQDAVRRVRFIKRSQELGFSLAEIQELLRLRDDTTATCGDVLEATEAKIAAVDRKLQDLKKIKKALLLLTKTCSKTGSARQCPILESLDSQEKET